MTDDNRALTIWLPVKLINALNARTHWTVDAKRAQLQRDAVCAAVLQALGRRHVRVAASVPKSVTFVAHVARLFDDDGLPAALKHVRDGLIDAGLISGDGPIHGHRFTYTQAREADPLRRGVSITITVQ